MKDYHICVIGSGAGGGPIAFEAARAGLSVVVLEKGPWFTEKDFFKDELACCLRRPFRSSHQEEPQVIEEPAKDGWSALPTSDPNSGHDYWNGNCVGGSSNFMSGHFFRLKPDDFRLLSTFGPIEGAHIADWPISYDDMEPYYAKVEKQVGVSGRVVPHKFAEPRSTSDFPYPPTAEHLFASWIDKACGEMGLTSLPIARAILPAPAMGRRGCEYSGFCGSFGCSSGAKGGARAALLDPAVATGRCEIRPHAHVYKLESDNNGRVTGVLYFDREGNTQRVDATVYVVACQAIETSRLLLLSTGPKHPHGLGNNHGQVGRNLVFSAGATGAGRILYSDVDPGVLPALKQIGPFVNRGLQDWYYVDDAALGGRAKGGSIDFVLNPPNFLGRALAERFDPDGDLVWGTALKRRLEQVFTQGRILRFELFCDWLPNDDCFVSLDASVKDKWGLPVSRTRIGHHPHDDKVSQYLADRAIPVMEKMGLRDVHSRLNGAPTPNLQAGGCRFGTDPKTSVLDADCRVHAVENLYVSDGSFMPTGGSVTFTFTIYANAFRVADRIIASLPKT
ncbi:MAG: GMC family oxidoreductase [Chromatiales bacterium]